MVQYYSRFLPGLATTLAPLHRLLKKDVQWRWTSEEQRAYERCKTNLSTDALFVHYDAKRELRLACDASSHGLGGVISHVIDDRQERPIAFASRPLTASEKNYGSLVFGLVVFSHCSCMGASLLVLLTTSFFRRSWVPTPLLQLLLRHVCRNVHWRYQHMTMTLFIVVQRNIRMLALCQDYRARIQKPPWRVKFILLERFMKIFRSWLWTLHKRLFKIHCCARCISIP